MVVTSPVDPLCCPIVFCPWTIAADHVHSSTPADLDSSPLSDRRHITEQGEGPYSNRGSARRLLGLSVEAFGTRCCSAPHWADFSENKRGGGDYLCVYQAPVDALIEPTTPVRAAGLDVPSRCAE